MDNDEYRYHNKGFFDRSEIIADAFNTLIFKKYKVKPDTLKTVDLVPVFQRLADLSGKSTFEEYLESYKRTVVMENDEICCAIMAETEINYALPIKARLLELGLYAEQESHQDTAKQNPKLTPVITLVFYLSPKDWEGHYKLSDMCPKMDERLLSIAPEYKLNMAEPAKLSKEDMPAFSTELGKVLCAIKNSGDEKAADVFSMTEYSELSEKAKALMNSLFA